MCVMLINLRRLTGSVAIPQAEFEKCHVKEKKEQLGRQISFGKQISDELITFLPYFAIDGNPSLTPILGQQLRLNLIVAQPT